MDKERLSETENENAGPEIINSIFRLFHSIKGSSGYLNAENIREVTLETESLLEIFKDGMIAPSQEQTVLLYQTMDFLKQLITKIEIKLEDKNSGKTDSLLVRDIHSCIQNLEEDAKKGRKEIGK